MPRTLYPKDRATCAVGGPQYQSGSFCPYPISNYDSSVGQPWPKQSTDWETQNKNSKHQIQSKSANWSSEWYHEPPLQFQVIQFVRVTQKFDFATARSRLNREKLSISTSVKITLVLLQERWKRSWKKRSGCKSHSFNTKHVPPIKLHRKSKRVN
jgi:hypothetical protein